MSTSGGTIVNAAGYLVVVLAVLALAGRAVPGGTERLLRRPARAAIALWVVVAVPSILQFAAPVVFDALARRPELIERGQVWRLLTSMVVQDGGVFGTVFNLVLLYVVACAAVPVWGGLRAAVLFVAGGTGFNLVATFVLGAPGAGNSAATFALAAALAGGLAVWRRSWRTAGTAALTAVVGAGLLLIDDAHGFAFLGGLVLGGLVGLVSRPATRVPAG